MAKAQHVRGIRPDRSLRENAARVVAVRTEELLSWSDAFTDASLWQDLHNMRIAAKRVRYALEMFSVCFPVKDLLTELTALQEMLGDIHDLDVLHDLMLARVDELDARVPDRVLALDESGEDRERLVALVRELVSDPVTERLKIGLLCVLHDKVRERQSLFERARDRWGEGKLEEFGARIRQTVGSEASGRDVAVQEKP